MRYALLIFLFLGCGSGETDVVNFSEPVVLSKTAATTCLSDVTPVSLTDGCGNDPRFYVPMANLYLDSVDMPSPYRVRGETAGRQIKPLNSNGQPSSTGRIYIRGEGHSNALRVFAELANKLNSSSLENSSVRLINDAQGGMALENWVASGVGTVDPKVQVVLLHHSLNKGFTDCSQQMYMDSTDYYLKLRIAQLRIKHPNLKQVFVQSREFGGWKCYSSPGALAEPAGYYNGFGVRQFVDYYVHANESIFVAWSFNPWNPNTPRSWFEGAGLHPCIVGSKYWADMWFNFLLTDSTTKMWFAR